MTSIIGCWASGSLPRVSEFGGLKAVLRARTRSLSNLLRHWINSPAYGTLRDNKLAVDQDQRATRYTCGNRALTDGVMVRAAHHRSFRFNLTKVISWVHDMVWLFSRDPHPLGHRIDLFYHIKNCDVTKLLTSFKFKYIIINKFFRLYHLISFWIYDKSESTKLKIIFSLLFIYFLNLCELIILSWLF
jgi:hypothetical protein